MLRRICRVASARFGDTAGIRELSAFRGIAANYGSGCGCDRTNQYGTQQWKRSLCSGGTRLQNQSSQQQAEPFSSFNDPDTSSFAKDKEEEEEFQMKMNILAASLNHVNTLGWSTGALRAGAADLGLSDAVASVCTPFDLVEYFQRSANHQLETHLKSMEKSSLYSSMEYRLKLVTPFIDRYHQAMGLSLEPPHVPRGLQILRDLTDTICINGLGDSATDLRWYAKRTGIISIYVATECCLVQDKSEGFQETWEFLQRRVKDYDFFEKAGSTALPILESGFTTLVNILGMNRRR